jgi:hypothetical protein
MIPENTGEQMLTTEVGKVTVDRLAVNECASLVDCGAVTVALPTIVVSSRG